MEQGGKCGGGAAHENRGMKSSMAEVAESSAVYVGTPRLERYRLERWISFPSSPVPERTCGIQT